jgi:hypothetical protein
MVSGFDRQAITRGGGILRIGIPTIRAMRKRRQRTHGYRNHHLFHFVWPSALTMWNKHVNYTLPPAVLSTTASQAYAADKTGRIYISRPSTLKIGNNWNN